MALKIAQFIQLLLLCVIAGQAFFYLIGGTAGVRNVSVGTFIEQRKAIDVVIVPALKLIYLLSAASGFTAMVLLQKQSDRLPFILSALAWALVLIDMAIAVRGNVPLNRQMQDWSPASHPSDWARVRDRWLTYLHWRQACSITALLCLLVGLFTQI
ncbi:anthrone oxygenase family protein [Salmonirosea aquatica]|uniref:DUF1772 domain-containing protein n=1 Tax=Salmonirosea aquatica TaxID=2654236 RepID=A0A7C9FT21_9BACT|nr:DUF1772 domain-containing protein [Cytophagaceae bacterium SJW1-29]